MYTNEYLIKSHMQTGNAADLETGQTDCYGCCEELMPISFALRKGHDVILEFVAVPSPMVDSERVGQKSTYWGMAPSAVRWSQARAS